LHYFFYCSEKEARLTATTSHIGKFLADFRHLASVSEAEKAAELSDVTQLKQNLGSSSDNDIVCICLLKDGCFQFDSGAATKRRILQRLRHKTVFA
jgi:hypothetical protein